MSAPSFPLVNGQTQTIPLSAVTLALTLNVDPDNPVPGDLHLLNGQIHFWDGFNAKWQKTIVLLKFVRGEWFLNIEEGIPYFTQILVHNPDSKAIVSLLRKALLASPGAVSVPVLTLTIDRPSRTATVNFQVVFDDSTVLTSADFPPFILKTPT